MLFTSPILFYKIYALDNAADAIRLLKTVFAGFLHSQQLLKSANDNLYTEPILVQ